MKKLLIVGGTGFVGSWINRQLSKEYTKIFCTGRDVDVRDFDSISKLVEDIMPDVVIHLAAVTTLHESYVNPRLTYDTNFIGTLNLLLSLQAIKFKGVLLFVSTSEVYGLKSETCLPISELQSLNPLSPYAVSKIAAEHLCYQHSHNSDFKIVIARPFNHIGPGQSSKFSISNFARQLSLVKIGKQEPILAVGDLDVTRDFLDVRDVVNAYKNLIDFGVNGQIYNVCSGRESSIRSLVNNMCNFLDVEVELRPENSRLRIEDRRRIYGDNSKITLGLNWRPTIDIEVTLTDIVSWWMEEVLLAT